MGLTSRYDCGQGVIPAAVKLYLISDEKQFGDKRIFGPVSIRKHSGRAEALWFRFGLRAAADPRQRRACHALARWESFKCPGPVRG